MDEVIRLFAQHGWLPRSGLGETDIERLEADLGIRFPSDFRAFLRWSNGGEGFLGAAYVQIDSAEEMRHSNDEHFRTYFPGLVQIGGNGGLESYCLDYRTDPAQPNMVAIDRVNSGPNSYWPLRATFTDTMRRLAIVGDPWPPSEASPG